VSPLYETQRDRDNEKSISTILEAEFGCEVAKMPMKLGLDFMACRSGRAVAFIEFKRRKNRMLDYSTYMISLHKMRSASSLARCTGLKCFLVVQWSDAIGMCEIPPDDMDIRIGGTTRRGDPEDIEPVVHFDLNKFKLICSN
tara:strand:+ start:92 stop:517 length:426 start_codon:yes stop_codon:yes gene_type:complete